MMTWEDWGPEAFEKAREQRRPVYLHRGAVWSQKARAMEALCSQEPVAALLMEKFVPIRVDIDDRPDLSERYAAGHSGPVLLDYLGRTLSRPPHATPAQLAASLKDAADAFYPSGAGADPEDPQVWTGAVGPAGGGGKLDPAWPAETLAALKRENARVFPCLDCLELFLYAAREWKDADAQEKLAFQLTRLAGGGAQDGENGGFARPEEEKRLGVNARLARLYWDAFALTGQASFRDTALKTSSYLLAALADRDCPLLRTVDAPGRSSFHADANAMAVIALLKAGAHGGGSKFTDGAQRILLFLPQLFDSSKGMAHRWTGKPELFGFLGDDAWVILAFTESFLVTGLKAHREFADALLKVMFQELWERDYGGFCDRPADPDAIGALKEQRLVARDNAVAFEAIWRLHELKGNTNYRRWLEMGLKTLVPKARTVPCVAAPLVRLQDMHAKGRLDLELVGRPEDPRTAEILTVLHRHYLPRKVVSFVDPDDQDYIMAHHLETRSFPRLFGCVDLKPEFEAGNAEEIAVLLEALR